MKNAIQNILNNSLLFNIVHHAVYIKYQAFISPFEYKNKMYAFH